MTSLRILVVDDDRDFAESLVDIFEDLGHEVELVFDGESAIERCKAQHFDITFIDVRLPGIDGFESLSALRQVNPAAKVIMMTGYKVEPLLEQAVERGALAAFFKPFDMDGVLAVLEEVFSGHQEGE